LKDLANRISKIAKIAFRGSLILLLLIGVLIFLVNLPAVQKRLLETQITKLENATGAEITFSKIHFRFPNRLEIEDALVRDLQKDTLFYIEKLTGKGLRIDFSSFDVSLKKVTLDKPYVNFYKPALGEDLNYYFFTSYLAQPSGQGGDAATILFEELVLNEGRFFYTLPVDAKSDRLLFDENRIRFQDIHAELKDFTIIEDSLHFDAGVLAFYDRCGLVLENLEGEVTIARSGIELNEYTLTTEHSKLNSTLEMQTRNYMSYGYFLDSVALEGTLGEALIDMRDLRHFSSELESYKDQNIKLSGRVSGPISDFSISHLNAVVSGHTTLSGKAELKGLPDAYNTFIKADIQQLKTTRQALENELGILLPKEIKSLNGLAYQGKFVGFLSDFYLDGDLETNLGNLTTRSQVKQNPNWVSFEGQVISKHFNLEPLFQNAGLGTASFDLSINSYTSFQNEADKFEIDGVIPKLVFQDYSYKNIQAKGAFLEQAFKGEAHIQDTNCRLDFNGSIDLNRDQPIYQFKSTIKYANLNALGLYEDIETFKGKFDVNLVGNTLDNLQGKGHADSLYIAFKDTTLQLDSFSLSATKVDGIRQIDIGSDFLDASINGKFDFSSLDVAYAEFIHNLFPDYYAFEEKTDSIYLKLNAIIRDNEIISLFTPVDLGLGGGKLDAYYNNKLKSLDLNGELDKFQYENYELRRYYVNIRKKPFQLLNLSTEVDEVYDREKLITRKGIVDASILPNYAEFLFHLADTQDQLAFRGYGELNFSRDSVALEIHEGKLFTLGKSWVIQEPNLLEYIQGDFLTKALTLQSGTEEISISGGLKNQRQDTISLAVTRFDLNSLNALLDTSLTRFGGLANGNIKMVNILERPIIITDFNIQELSYNEDTLGNLSFTSEADDHPLVMNIKGKIKQGLMDNSELSGRIDFRREKPLNLNLKLKQASAAPLNSIFEGVASNFSGSISTENLGIFGSFEKPKFSGNLSLNNITFHVDYLGTVYSITDDILFSNNLIDMGKFTVLDSFGQRAKGHGYIAHNFFEDITLDIHIDEADKFNCLRTTYEDNSLFYGDAFIKGKAHFYGPLDDIKADITAESEENTHLTIPLYSDNKQQLASYVYFKSDKDSINSRNLIRNKVDGITMNFDFIVDEDAEIELVFDEVLNDKITGKGNGNIKMMYNSFGELEMYGRYDIIEGKYPFSSPPAFAEQFDIKGGSIYWNGDPYNAIIDLQASVQRKSAKPHDLISSYNENDKVTVDILLNLKGELFNPTIAFDLNFPNQSSTASSGQFAQVINQVKSDQDELNRQVFSLLTFGSFIPVNTFDNSGNSASDYGIASTVNSSLSSFISNQVTSWIAQSRLGEKGWELGVDWENNSNLTDAQKSELVVSVRKQLLNERLEFSGSLDAIENNNGSNPWNVNLVYRINKEGNLKLRAYRRMANDPTLGQISNTTTTGLGFYYRKQFNKLNWFNKDKPD
jgi:hypothetical protein